MRQSLDPKPPSEDSLVGRVIRADALIQRPWSGGVTTELAIFPAGAAYERRDFDCRVSTASVSVDGPFTPFPGYKRILALVSGAGMTLEIDGAPTLLDAEFQQVHFDGTAAVHAKLLNGEIHDLNVIFKAGVEARVSVVEISPVLQTVSLGELSSPGDKSVASNRVDLILSLHKPFRVDVGSKLFEVGARDVFEIRHAQLSAAIPDVRLQSSGEIDSLVVISLFLPEPERR